MKPADPIRRPEEFSDTGTSSTEDIFRVGLVEGTGPELESETKALLRLRLRALATVFLVIWAVLLLHDLGLSLRPVLTPLTIVVSAALGGLTVLLYLPVDLPLRVLRALEVAFLLMVICDQMLWARFEILNLVESGELDAIDGQLYRETLGYVFTILLYGIFIPNTWRRTAVVVSPVVILPLLNHLVLLLQIPQLGRDLNPADVSFRLLVVFFASAASVYGAYIIGGLRATAFRAKELGQYNLTEKLGSGGMGEVWKAEHKMLARPAAVKLIRLVRLGADKPDMRETLLRRFEREAQVTATLESPHSVILYDFGISKDNSFYYVMELLRGLDLEQLVRRYGPVSPARAIYFLSQACESLAEAHERALIHRDIKPANLFACRLGRQYDFIKVLDFGLVKTLDGPADVQITATDVITGTPTYMSPEQVLGEPVDAKSDIYALGCVAYWLVTGQLVFEASKASAVLIDHAKTPPQPPSKRLAGTLPEDLERLILQCLEKDPAKRPASAEHLLQSMRECRDAGQWGQEDAELWWNRNVWSRA